MRVVKEESVHSLVCGLKKGQVICLPTDTVHGLFCDARNKSAVKKIFAIKDRSLKKPLGIFVKDVAIAKQYAEINSKQERFLKDYWPGKVTFILKKRVPFPEGVGTKDTIGIRIPDYSLFEKIFQKIDFPLVQTSANISGVPSLLSAGEVIEQFKNRAFQPDLVLDAEKLPPAKPSTVVDLTGNAPKILRKGNEVDIFRNKSYKNNRKKPG